MVHRCCISSCGMNVRVVDAKGLSYHKFPTKEPIKDQWVQAIIPHLDKPEAFKVVPRYTRVCSRHFRKKDYCVDAKKRARLNSNAVPSVFPRKNTPLVIPTILPASPQLTVVKSEVKSEPVPAKLDPQPLATSNNVLDVESSPGVSATTGAAITFDKSSRDTLVEIVNADDQIDQLDQLNKLNLEQSSNDGGWSELLIESATIQDDHLVLTVMDSASDSQPEQKSLKYEDEEVTNLKQPEDGTADTKRRKRRKWNRTAFARPAKGKRKSLKTDTTDQDERPGDEEDEDDYLRSQTELSLSLDNQSQSSSVDESDSLNHVALLLNEMPDQSYHSTSVEQELLQSIQAVTLRCVGEDTSATATELQTVTADHLQFNSLHLVPAFLHHHSSEESLFSNESHSHNLGSGADDVPVTRPTVTSNEDDSLRFELVDLRIDPDVPPIPPPTYLDIDELAHQLNSSLFTDGNIPLFNHDTLNLSSDPPDDLFSNNEKETEKPPSKNNLNTTVEATAGPSTNDKTQKDIGKGKPNNKRSRGNGKVNNKETKKSTDKKFKGVTKRPKKDKPSGKFSVERFKSSDKDIEYYTGFSSYRNFEAFFRSLEAYIDKLRITDATYGINNLPSLPDADVASGESVPVPGSSDPPKKRNNQGRSMSRVNELFMTIIRLRRKLPEKVLGHMFLISQPTVSRVVRAWTVLLSKIIDSYPADKSMPSATAEHSYPSKGLGIPDAFRELFNSDLAKSIVVTSMNPKRVVKPKANKTKSLKPPRV